MVGGWVRTGRREGKMQSNRKCEGGREGKREKKVVIIFLMVDLMHQSRKVRVMLPAHLDVTHP